MIIETYKGVGIEQQGRHFYPTVNTDIEKRTVQEVKKWIDEVWLFVTNPFEDSVSISDEPTREVVTRGSEVYLIERTGEKYISKTEYCEMIRETVLFKYNAELS